ncbi:MAG TPA: hypothetical protein VLH75_15700 [Longimicrobiales bacterium]|nr:hypothetical protein [Longimicrobiales bacterium]
MKRPGLAILAVLAACALPPGTPGTMVPETLPPPGFGTLRQDEISVSLSSGPLQMKVTPLAESVTLVTAPDTHRRLSGLAARFGPDAAQATGVQNPSLFLVSLWSESPDATFVPEEIQLISRGVRLRPGAVMAVTPGWGERRLRQRETEMAVYAFGDAVELESELVVVYGLVESAQWGAILPQVQAERARAAARARGEAR